VDDKWNRDLANYRTEYIPIMKVFTLMSDLDELKELLITKSKHGNYEMLPPALLKVDPTLSLYSNSSRLDRQRYDWFSNKINFEGKKLLDIGANIGYFSLRLATEHNAIVTAYEPFEPHSRCIELSKRILNLTDDEFTVLNEGISLDKISSLERADIILFLNVLQHAGEDYDTEYVQCLTDWREYAVRYLNKLKDISEYLIFQMGYTWLGHDDRFCKDEDILDYTVKLLSDAGWSIISCGTVKSVHNPAYIDYAVNDSGKNHSPLTSKWDSISFSLRKRILGNRYDYRFMQRPIFICKGRRS